ncbi:glutamine-rich protein 2 [Bombina bombina]|uniref:glutamine-rich protein 2 n=1 Tax=Bombina bombina TaxID=8345 RepID=UPI00235A727F|nr:glutamine-rich protein 2 [Bombina bombina]
MAFAITLFDLANLSIGNPEAGAVNFNALHSLLHAILQHLNIQQLKTEMPEGEKGLFTPPGGQALRSTVEGQADRVPLTSQQVEDKLLAMEKMLNALPSGAQLMERSEYQKDGATPVGEMWRMMKMKKKVEANEDGVTKAMALTQELMHEVNALRQSQVEIDQHLQKFISSLGLSPDGGFHDFERRLSQIELHTGDDGSLNKLQKELISLQENVKELEGKLIKYPSPEELNNMVRWEVLRETLVKSSSIEETKDLPVPAPLETTASQTLTEESPAVAKDLVDPQALNQPGGPSLETTQKSDTTTIQTHPGGPVTSEPGSYLPVTGLEATHPPGSPSKADPEPAPTEQKPSISKLPIHTDTCIQTSDSLTPQYTFLSASCPYPDAMEALRKIGTLSDEHVLLRERVEVLEKERAAQEALRSQWGEAGFIDPAQALPNLQEKIDLLQREIQNMKEDHEKDEELLGHIQKKMLQLQEECDTFNKTAAALIEEQQQEEKHIDILYQSVAKLRETKADREHTELETDVKAAKKALERKVSRTQFDATTEQLNNMLQELLGRVNGQEQDWQRFLDKINAEMESKLDRMELFPLKQQLEDRWRALRGQLQNSSLQTEGDDAACIRKQLTAHFHCLSCDRPLDMIVPGPKIPSIPSIPALQTHYSNRPHMVYQLDQIRQQNRSDRTSEVTDSGYSNSARSCGGSSTRTYLFRRFAKLQSIATATSEEHLSAGITAKPQEEIAILGFDGQIYKGRIDSRFPPILMKENLAPDKDKEKLPQVSQKTLPLCDRSPSISCVQSDDMGATNYTARSSSKGLGSQSSLLRQKDPLTESQETLKIKVDLDITKMGAVL